MSLLDDLAARKAAASEVSTSVETDTHIEGGQSHRGGTRASTTDTHIEPPSTDARTRGRQIIERIYPHADPPTKKLLHELDALVFYADPKAAQKAVEIADAILLWATGETPLEGKALADATREIFGLGRVA